MSDPRQSIRRLVPDEPFPVYAYVPGKFPHPTRNAAHHSAGKPHSHPAPLAPDHWRECRTYLRGIDLFNHGYYWEAHEAWESLWHAAGRQGPVAEFLKGLIALAAAGVKAREGRAAGVQQHALRARSIFDAVKVSLCTEAQTHFLGLDLRTLIDNSTRIAEMPEKVCSLSEGGVSVLATQPPSMNGSAGASLHRCSVVAIVFEFQLRVEGRTS